MKNVSALALSKEFKKTKVPTPLKLLKTIVPPRPSDWFASKEFVFNSDKITVISLEPYSPDTYHLIYFDEIKKNEMGVIVPANFMFRTLGKKATLTLIKKYDEFLQNNLYRQCWFDGTIGSDPEIFVQDGAGEIIPAFNFLGSKEKPNGPTVGEVAYWDGFQGEFSTIPNECMGYHADSIQRGLQILYNQAIKFNKDAQLSTRTVFDISVPLIRESAPEHVAFGCMKSLNAYGMKGLEAPGNQVFYRSAGGHIHFGFAKKTEATIVRMVKALDAILGVACVSLFAKYDDPRRRQMYGLAGEYRLPPHGLEYRTLSNAWLFHPLLANIVFDLGRAAASFGERDYMRFWDAKEKETVEIINTCNVDGARDILSRNEKVFKSLLKVKYAGDEKINYVYNAIMNGLESVIANPEDIAKNWLLNGVWVPHCDAPQKNVQSCYLHKRKV